MNLVKRQILLFAGAMAFAYGVGTPSGAAQTSDPIRSFEFKYVTQIPELPEEAKALRLWIPLPRSDDYQTIAGLKVESPFPYVRHREPEYGNEFLYFQVPPPPPLRGRRFA